MKIMKTKSENRNLKNYGENGKDRKSEKKRSEKYIFKKARKEGKRTTHILKKTIL